MLRPAVLSGCLSVRSWLPVRSPKSESPFHPHRQDRLDGKCLLCSLQRGFSHRNGLKGHTTQSKTRW